MEFSIIAGTIVVFVIIMLFARLATYVSNYTRMSRLRNVIRLTLIEAENMSVTHNSFTENGENIISIVPEYKTDKFIFDLLELNLLGNGFASCTIYPVEIVQTEFYSDSGSKYMVPLVRVTIEDKQLRAYRDKIITSRIIYPEDLPVTKR